MPSNALSENTLELLRQIFPPEQHAAVATILEARCGLALPLMEAATPEALERIRFAVLKLSSGSLQELERAVSVANKDWRDVLVAAEFANSLLAHVNWFNAQFLA
jgi:hypothetical protein